MVPVTTNVSEMLRELAATFPVTELAKPTLITEFVAAVLPVLTFDTAPLASRLLRYEMFLVSATLSGAERNVSFNPLAVPIGEVHRYYDISAQQTGGSNRNFRLREIYNERDGAQISASVIANVDVGPAAPQNLLGLYGGSVPVPLSWSGVPLDLYPGSFWSLQNTEVLDLLATVLVTGIRFVLRGPNVGFGENISAEINSSTS